MPESGRWKLELGACVLGDSGVRFTVWAPHARRLEVRIIGQGDVQALRQEHGYFVAEAPRARPGERYLYVLDGKTARPDPASRAQSEGVHGPSMIIDPDAFRWSDEAWAGRRLDELIIYELHVGTFTRAGTFAGLIPRVAALRELGVTAIELMPVAQFPGARNWGYDGVSLYAPQSTYGGPDGLKALVNACHRHDMAVILDVVYNHLGPEGNYLDEFGPYFTDRYRTPWGRAVNYDGPDSDDVRRFIIDNALYWITEYHVDALRLDAIHGIYDFSATHILRELADAVHREGRRLSREVLLIGESDLNDVRAISPPDRGGYGLDAQWSDDFHHALHALLTGERNGYYEDFGRLSDLATAIQDGFVYAGQHSRHRRRRHGNSSRQVPPRQLVVCAQNHDQIGNRAFGDRLSTLVPWEALKVAAAAVLLAPHTPMLFMGEEYGETAPFQYFIDHADPGLVEAVRAGRRREFEAFGWTDVPDPADPATFTRSRLREDPLDERQSRLLAWYRGLLRLRTSLPSLSAAIAHQVRSYEDAAVITVQHRGPDATEALVLLSMNKSETRLQLADPDGRWRRSVWSWSRDFGGGSVDPPPADLRLGGRPVEVLLPAYGVIVYTKSP
ncbi:malto-oligosyltrehalose trehalohydrolase [Candidatus Nitrospira bockiana]